MKKLLFLLISVCSLSLSFTAEAKVVRGQVVDASNGEPLIGATITPKGGGHATATDLDGRFSIDVPNNVKDITVTYIGMVTRVVEAADNLLITMETAENTLDDVVVTAYGTSTKGAFTGSAGVVDAATIEKRQVSNLTQALSGTVAGVQIQSYNGQPGTSASVKVRGIGSLNAGTAPLYIVDGIPYDGDMSAINTADIESMTVLKDAASTALYGARGANGIIMITTKKGRSASNGKAVVTFDARWGANSRQIKNYGVLTSPKNYTELEYAAIRNAGLYSLGYDAATAHAYANANLGNNTAGGSGYQIYTVPAGESIIGMNGKLNPNAALGYWDGKNYYTPDNWSDIMFQSQLRQEYNLSISGNSSRNNFYLSLGYLDDGGIVKGSGFERLTTRIRDEYIVNNWLKVGANVAYTYYKNQYPGDQTREDGSSSGNAFFIANFIAPIYPMYVRDSQCNIMENGGRPVYDYGDQSYTARKRSFMSQSNPAGALIYDKTEYLSDVLNSNWFIELNPVQGLTLKASYGLSVDNTRYNKLYNAYMGQFADMQGNADQLNGRETSLTQQYTVNYNNRFADVHSIDVTAGYEGFQWRYNTLYATASCLYDPESFYVSNGINNKNNGSRLDRYATRGYFARVNYSYNDRYIGNIGYRRDASSRFSPDNRWGNFLSGSVAWVISNEKFLEGVDNIDLLKLKASVGQQGNDAVGNYYAWLDQYQVQGANGVFSDGTLSYKGNPDLTWETSTSYNVGVDFGFFGNKLNGSIEYFARKSKDMLYYKPVAGSNGYSQIPMNVGSITNSGLEIDLNYNIFNTKNFTWDINANATIQKSKINELHPDLEGQLIDGSYIYTEGEEMYQMYLVKWAGVNPENGVAQYWALDKDGNEYKTENYTLAQENRKAVNMLPRVYGGFGTNLTFFGVDASCQLAYQIGGHIFDSGYQRLMHCGYTSYAGNNWHKDIYNAWTPENTNTDVPRLCATDKYANSTSTRFLEKASYLALNNITVGYTVPEKAVRKLGLSSLRVYFAADNLGLISARKGLDPRQSYYSSSTNTYSAMRTISGGLNLSF